MLTDDKEKLLFENETLEKQQKKLQRELDKRVQSKKLEQAERTNKRTKRAFEMGR